MPHGVEQQQATTTESSDSFNLGRRNSGRLFGKSRNVDNADSDDGLSPTTTTTTMSSAVMSLKKQESQFHKLFPTIPQQELLLETYSCALKKDFLYHGKMFVSQNWICFHSRIIHKQLQVTIPVGSVRTIKKHRMVKLLPNALCLLTSDGTKYRFTSLMSRDTTYNHLHSLCKNLEDHNSEAALPCPDPSHSAPSRRPRPRSLLLNPPEEFSRSVRRRASCQDQALARTPLSGDFQGSYCTQCETPPRIDSPDGAPPSRHGDGEDDDSDGGRRGSTPRSDSEDGSPTRGAESGNSGRDPPRCNGHAKGPPGWPCPALTDPGPAGKKRSLSLLWLYLFIVLLLVLVSCYMAVRINLLEEMLARIAIPPKPPLRPQRYGEV